MSFRKVYLWNIFCQPCHRRPNDLEYDDWNDEWHIVNIVDVYDGDTCTVEVCRNGKWILQKVRMMGYDTPEMKPPKNQPNRELEIELAKKSRQAFINYIGGKQMWMYCHGREKYGRILGTMYHKTTWSHSDESVNVWMVSNGYGKSYDGGTKESHV